MEIRAAPKIGLIAIVAFIFVCGFSLKTASALNLPVEAGLGQSCSATVPCESQFFCSVSEAGGKCVQCEDYTNCDESLNETCIDNLCTLTGGNNAGDLCASDSNCKSGLTCGTRGICEEAASLPSGCFDTDGDDRITEEDCSTSENEACSLCEAVPGPGEEAGPGEENWWGIDLTIEDVGNIINGLACWATRIATAVMVIFLILAGFRFMNARGNPTAYQGAIKNFQHVLIGILVIMAVYVIIATVAHAVGRTDFSLIPLIC